jgi:hypothetical protein
MPISSVAFPKKSNSTSISPANGIRRCPRNIHLSHPAINGFMHLSIRCAADVT